MKNVLCVCALVGAAGLLVSPAQGAAFGLGNLVVVQVGDGSAALSASATAGFVNEYLATGGASLQQIPLPTSISGANKRLTLSGTATSEGFLTLTGNGQYLTVGGYDAATGTASVTSSNASAVNRVLGRIDLLGNVDSSTGLADNVNLGNVRSVVSSDGINFWAGMSATGVRFATFGTTAASTQISSAPTNTRVANIFSGQLYISAASSTFQGVSMVGTGLPTTSGQTITQLPGFPTAAGPSAYDYLFSNPNTLYVADDRSAASGGGIQKWTFDGSVWALQYTLPLGTTTTGGARGLAGTVDGSGNVVLYATTTESSANRLVSITDTGAGSIFTTLATAPANTAFRGVEFIPVPGPATLALLGLGGLVVGRRKR